MHVRRTTSAILIAVMLLSVVPVRPARAEGAGYLVYGLLVGALTALGILAYQADYGDDKPLETPDKSGRKTQESASIEVVPTPASDDENRPQDLGAGLAFTARF